MFLGVIHLGPGTFRLFFGVDSRYFSGGWKCNGKRCGKVLGWAWVWGLILSRLLVFYEKKIVLVVFVSVRVFWKEMFVFMFFDWWCLLENCESGGVWLCIKERFGKKYTWYFFYLIYCDLF